MKIIDRSIFKRIIQIFIIASLSFIMDFLVVVLSNDESIWLGESIEVVGSVIWGPAVGGIATLISSVATDYVTYQSFDYSFVSIFEASSMALIGLIYRTLNKDEDRFGFHDIVIFNFVQVLVNVAVLYLATPPAAVLFFDFITDDWTRDEMREEMAILGENTFSACISIALIGTILLAVCIKVRKHMKEHGSLTAAIRSIFKLNYMKKEYRSRAFEYSIGIIFAVALTMIDGVVSGHVLGMDALAATSLVFPLVSFSSFLSGIITSGCSNLCARAKGDGNYEKAEKLFTLGLCTVIVLGIIQTVVFFFTQDAYFKFYSSTKEIEAFARQYYAFYIFVPPFMAVGTFLDEMVSSDGDDMLSYAGYLVSFFVNVGASIILSGIMGMGGLALGTMLSYIFYLIVVSIHFLKKSNTLKIRFYFSIADIFRFGEYSLKANAAGICMTVTSASFTKSIIMFWGNEYLIANTVLCAMLEIYRMFNGPSEAAEYLLATYEGEKNREGVETIFKESLSATLICSVIISLILLLIPGVVLAMYGIEDTPFISELIKCIRYCAVGLIAASLGDFLGDYYGNTGKPLWSSMLVFFRTALFPVLFCVTLSLEGGIVAMGKGMLLAQIFAVSVFYGFILITKGDKSIPFMIEDTQFERVTMNSFEYSPNEFERVENWIKDNLTANGIDKEKAEDTCELILSILNSTREKNGEKKVLGECVLRFISDPEIIIKDNGTLMKPDIEDDRINYNVLLSCNSSTIRV